MSKSTQLIFGFVPASKRFCCRICVNHDTTICIYKAALKSKIPMKRCTLVVLGILCLTASAFAAGKPGRVPAGMPRSETQAEQMLNASPGSSYTQSSGNPNANMHLRLIGACRNSSGGNAWSGTNDYAGCVDSGPVSTVSAQNTRFVGGGVQIGN